LEEVKKQAGDISEQPHLNDIKEDNQDKQV